MAIQWRKSVTLVNTAGSPPPHVSFPKLTIPYWTNRCKSLTTPTSTSGPPESPGHESMPSSLPAHKWWDTRLLWRNLHWEWFTWLRVVSTGTKDISVSSVLPQPVTWKVFIASPYLWSSSVRGKQMGIMLSVCTKYIYSIRMFSYDFTG